MKENKKEAARAQSGPTCPQCGEPMYYNYEAGGWECFYCK